MPESRGSFGITSGLTFFPHFTYPCSDGDRLRVKSKSYVWMLSKVPAESSAYTTLKNAPPSGRMDDGAQAPNYVVECNPEADLFFAIAKEYCPEAVADIEQAIRISFAPAR